MVPAAERMKTDVLIIGGGLAGCLGAITAAKKGSSVVLVDKAWTGGTGASTFAAGDILWYDPKQDNLDEWLKKYSNAGYQMFDPEWFEWLCLNVHDMVLEMDTWGIPFEKDAQGNFVRKPGRGHNAAVMAPGFKHQKKLRSLAEGLKIKLLDRVMITSLLTVDGTVAGAAGFHVRTGQGYIIEAKSTVIAAGGCSYKGNYHGQDMMCGEGLDLALRVGAECTNMEFANVYSSTAKDFDICGMSRFQRLGGRFTNAHGEHFMERYDPVNQDGAHLNILQRAMALEVREGRGPIYFDLSSMSPENRELSHRLIPMFFEACESKGIKPFEQLIEWMPGFVGAGSCGAGITLRSFACDTTVPGLFASGDAANEGLVIGSLAGPGGINLSWALVTGWKAGEGAAEAAAAGAALTVPSAEMDAALAMTFEKLGHAGGLDMGDAVYNIQSLVIPAKYNILRSGDRLREALEGLESARRDMEERINVRDPHELMGYHELRGMLVTAEMTFRCALLREESRGSHYREDFPDMDNRKWAVWTQTRLEGGQLAVRTEPIPFAKFERYGLEVPR